MQDTLTLNEQLEILSQVAKDFNSTDEAAKTQVNTEETNLNN